jgi:uncharacterized protein YecE (DUF72 family)
MSQLPSRSKPPTPRARAERGVVRVGTQGWNYSAWVGPFYPADTRPASFLSVYARAFDTVEIDATFYSVPSPTTVRNWAERVPAGFTFALKMPQEVTHEHRLRDVDEVTDTFFARARMLGSKLGPVLFQFAPEFGPAELPALAAFLPRLPRDVAIAVEFRHRGWIHDGVLALLAEHNVALALTDTRFIPRRVTLSLIDRPTADFAYVRWLGSDRDLVDHSRLQVDRSRDLAVWGDAIRHLQDRVKTVYAYMSNFFAGHAPASARMLQEAMGQSPVAPDRLGDQLMLF